ncbi:hypothetical protein llg_14880 [Luteolibacter sp. LG18]|nr:hypothetical protein llg_14880 [Luteolibacter sp. LG18]
MAAATLLGLGAWQAARISVDTKTHAAAVVKGPPKKTRSDGRKPSAKELAVADPVGAYLTRAKRGMTEAEVRWMLEDFITAGLTPPEGPTFPLTPARRAKQQDWYLEALAEGLSLTPEQKRAARERMQQSLQEDVAAFAKGIAGVGAIDPSGGREWIPDNLPLGVNVGPEVWLAKRAYAPWRLADLTPEQEKLTFKSDRESPVTRDSTMLRLRELALQEGLQITDRVLITNATRIFPLAPVPAPLESIQVNPLTQAKLLHPAQLRMALLLDPQLAPVLMGALDFPKAPAVPERFEFQVVPAQPPVATDPSTPQTPPDE